MSSWIINFVLFSGIYYLLYVAFFRNKSFYQLNRIVLLGIPVLSISIPLVAPYFQDPLYNSTGIAATLLPIEINTNKLFTVESSSPNVNWIWLLYISGATCFLLSFILGLIKTLNLIRKAKPAYWNNLPYLISGAISNPFSFFDKVIVPEKLDQSENLPTILIHEEVHRLQKHSYDNVYYNIIGSLFWFNPFIHLLAKELRQAHECLADQKALEDTSREVYAQMLLSSAFGTEVALPVTTGVASPFFNSSLIKTRITMLYKKKSPGWLRFSYLILLPAIAIMSLHACNKATEDKAAIEKQDKALTIKDISQPPLFADCDQSADKEEQVKCFQMGIRTFIIENFKYPEEAYEQGVEGKVFVDFIVNENGNLSSAEIIKGVEVDEDESDDKVSAAKAIEGYSLALIKSLPKMTPAQKDGKAVSMKFTLPISFKLN